MCIEFVRAAIKKNEGTPFDLNFGIMVVITRTQARSQMAHVQDDARTDTQDQLPGADDDYSEEYRTGETYEIEFEHPETAESNVDFDDDVEYLDEYDGGENGGNGADPSPE